MAHALLLLEHASHVHTFLHVRQKELKPCAFVCFFNDISTFASKLMHFSYFLHRKVFVQGVLWVVHH